MQKERQLALITAVYIPRNMSGAEMLHMVFSVPVRIEASPESNYSHRWVSSVSMLWAIAYWGNSWRLSGRHVSFFFCMLEGSAPMLCMTAHRGDGCWRCAGDLHRPQHEHHGPASDGGGLPLSGGPGSGGHLHFQLHGPWGGRPCCPNCHLPGHPHWHRHHDRQATPSLHTTQDLGLRAYTLNLSNPKP